MPIVEVTTPPGHEPAASAALDTDKPSGSQDNLTLFAGTKLRIDPDDYDSHPQSNFKMARQLLREDALALDDDAGCLILLEDRAFSVSASAVLVKGGAGSGWLWWVVSEPNHTQIGQKIKCFQNQLPLNKDAPAQLPNDLQAEMCALNCCDEQFVGHLRDLFQSHDRLTTLNGLQAWQKASWPSGPGVYLVWRIDRASAIETLLYAGMTGKFVRNGDDAKMNNGKLSDRFSRWTPYCFQRKGPHAQHFEFKPTVGSTKIEKLPFEERYQLRVAAEHIRVECFKLGGWEKLMAPSLLEAMILQNYVYRHDRLPPANNEF